MSLVRGKGTKPELAVRRVITTLGYRYRSHVSRLPGKPDFVFSRRRKIIFVHGCFWHRHKCALGRVPKSRNDFWLPKLEGNRKRDARITRQLKRDGWRVLVIWECQLAKHDRLARRVREFLDA
jgi:DNA mismatch endonuclease (patch repair protein)